MKSMIALLVVLVLAVCQIDAYPQPIFFPGGSGAGFGGGNAGPFGASGFGDSISNAYNGGFSSGYGQGFGSTSPFGYNAGGSGNSFLWPINTRDIVCVNTQLAEIELN